MKNSTCKRVLAAALSAAMAVGLAACGSTSSSATGSVVTGTDSGTSSTGKSDNSSNGLEADDLDDIIPDDTVTLTCYSQLSNYSGEMTGWFAQVLKDKFNVKINIGSMKDKELAESYRAKGQAYVDELIPLADKLFAQIEELC